MVGCYFLCEQASLRNVAFERTSEVFTLSADVLEGCERGPTGRESAGCRQHALLDHSKLPPTATVIIQILLR